MPHIIFDQVDTAMRRFVTGYLSNYCCGATLI